MALNLPARHDYVFILQNYAPLVIILGTLIIKYICNNTMKVVKIAF